MSINPKVTKKQIKEGYAIIAYCGYCDLYYTLQDAQKVGHTERAEGWVQMYTKLLLVFVL